MSDAFDREAALRRAAAVLQAKLLEDTLANPDVIRRQVSGSVDSLLGKQVPLGDRRYLGELYELMTAEQRATTGPDAQLKRDMAGAAAPKTPASQVVHGEYAAAWAADKGVDLEANRARFADYATERTQAAFRAQDAGSDDFERLARQALHFSLLAGQEPNEYIVALSRGQVATEADFR